MRYKAGPPQRHTEGLDLGGHTRTGAADVMLISSGSEDEAPDVPLAQRLKRKQDEAMDASSAAPSNRAGSQLSCRGSVPESECFHGGSSGQREGGAVPQLTSGCTSVSPAKRKAEEEPQRGKEALRLDRRAERNAKEGPQTSWEEPQRGKEALRLDRRAERNAKEGPQTSWEEPQRGKEALRLDRRAERNAKEGPQTSWEEPQRGKEALRLDRRAERNAKEGPQTSWEEPQRGKEALRLDRRAERNAKTRSPEESVKHLVASVDPALLQLEEGGALLMSLQHLGCSCAVEKQAVPRSVSWTRRAPAAQPADAGGAPEAHVVMQMTVDDFIALTHNYIQAERHGGCGSGPTLTSWMQEQQKRNPDKSLSLVVIDLEKYFRSQKSQSQKRFRQVVAGEELEKGKVTKRRKNVDAEVKPQVSRADVEEALVHLQLHTNVLVRFLMTWRDFRDHITMTTKAVAEAPLKRQREETSFSFYLESEWAGGQKVDKAGVGLLQVWKRQIQQLNRVSPDMASAILAAYPSPQLLRKAYNLCKSEQEKVSLLSDLLVRRGEGVTSTTRRVGPELSKRLFLLMNSRDPDATLDSGV
ncbi:crossover junction endonuclease EME1-like [Brachionichthys hirsutus]|uniref:crossover junction endonuclease EME1-like n=1 Tax=Brachionichthys hirsutus TaxID=412623 RepID=UPI003604F674